MTRREIHRYTLLFLLSVIACAPTRPTVREQVELSQRAFTQGRVLQAYGLLRQYPLPAESAPQLVQFERQVTQAAETLVARMLEKAEFLWQQNRPLEARRTLEELSALLPPADPLAEKAIRRARDMGEQIGRWQREIAGRVAEARADFEAGRLEKAREGLNAASGLAEQYHLPLGLEEELLLAECLRRLPPEPSPPPEPEMRKKALPEKPLRPAEPPAAAPDPLSLQTEPLLRQASELVRAGQHLEAIEAYRRVLKIDPHNRQARLALDELEPVRQRLVRELLDQAARFFARQQLDEAAPFYEKVLRIDPGNIRAKEGLEMYRRLQELRQKARPAGN